MTFIEAVKSLSGYKIIWRKSDPRRRCCIHDPEARTPLFGQMNGDGSASPMPLSIEEILAEDWTDGLEKEIP